MIAHQWLPWRVVQAAAILFVGIGVWQVLSGRPTDLIEGRRRMRLILAIVVGIVIAGLTIYAAVTSPVLRVQNGLVTAGIVLTLALLSAVHHLGFIVPPDLVTVVPAGVEASPGVAIAAPVAIDPEERALLERLRRLMEEDRVYREEGLGIASLAMRLGLPEYRLRRLINQRLGHRNFTSFVNGYRLAETIAALSDPSQAQVPILTIALDAGFQSIGPFNRAFKTQTGMTPTDFRRERIERAASSRAAE
jgi:AraC-like DNA-binding protein